MRVAVLLAGVLFSSTLFARVDSGMVTIKRIEISDTFFTLYPTSGAINHANCEDGSKVVFWRSDFPNGFGSVLSVAMTAYVAKKQVFMWQDGCKAGPWGKTLPKAVTLNVMEK